jgi:hypothetical protein
MIRNDGPWKRQKYFPWWNKKQNEGSSIHIDTAVSALHKELVACHEHAARSPGIYKNDTEVEKIISGAISWVNLL